MTELEVKKIGKKYYHNWIFKNLSFSLKSGDTLLITGSNGSGKSTLMKILAGQTSATSGELSLLVNGKAIEPHLFYQKISWSGPYFDLYDDLTLKEAVSLHFSFRECMLEDPLDFIKKINLEKHAIKQLKHFSSGMLHRIKVGLSIFTKSEILLLDEPGTNLDQSNADLLFKLAAQEQSERILIFVSNNQQDFSRFDNRLDLDSL